MTRLLGAALVVVAALPLGAGTAAAAQPVGPRADRVLIFTMPGVTWQDIVEARTPALDGLIASGAVAAMSVRTAARRTDPERGYLTLGAGNRANVRTGDVLAQLAFRVEDPFEGGTAGEALMRRTGRPPRGEIVHLGVPMLERRQRTLHYGTDVGALGQALSEAGIRRAVVSAADLADDPQGTATLRRSPVLGLVDATGSLDTGRLSNLLTPEPQAPFGLATEPAEFVSAVREALASAQVVLAEPGETLRADAFTEVVASERQTAVKRWALERTDALLGGVLGILGPGDVVIVVSVAGPQDAPREQLTPLVVAGHGVEPGLLTSPSTRWEGLAALTDVAPAVLGALGVPVPASMTGTPLLQVADPSDNRTERMAELSRVSLVRERVTPFVAAVLTVLLFLLALVAFLVFVGDGSQPQARVLLGLAYMILAIPPATLLARAVGAHALTDAGYHLVIWSLVVALAALVAVLPGPRWAGGVMLLLVSAALHLGDGLLGGPLQLNAVFGHSPIVAGRFYGLSNGGHAILYPAAILGLLGLLDLMGRRRVPLWSGAALLAVPLVVGLPMFGANFGGFIAGLVGVGAAFALARGWRFRLPWVAGVGVGAVALAAGLTALDAARPPEVRTHLGRFALRVSEGGWDALTTVVTRKIQANLGVIGFTSWTLMIPIALAVCALFLMRPRGVLRDTLPRHPLLRAALIGSIVTAVVGFAVNDSGIAIPALILGHVAPFLVLLALDADTPPGLGPVRRTSAPGSAAPAQPVL